MPVPHFDTPEHPESHLMYDVVSYLQNHNLILSLILIIFLLIALLFTLVK